MSRLSREEFVHLLLVAARMSVEIAQEQVSDSLPQEICWELAGFGRSGTESFLDEIIEWLYQDGRFPAIVDVTVTGALNAFTIVRLGPSGHEFVDDTAKTWNSPQGMGPFKPLGLMVPSSIWQHPRPLSLDDLQEAASGWPKK